ncbi:hypothetical protein BWK69_00305 [Candidatus Parcubacteria bacterium A4]|nr:MAG: hypothetical protein BWK69_00305 [Candidatus Parcubacteria bacterium A4]
MKEGFCRSEFIPPEERNLHQFKGKMLKEDLEGEEENPQENTGEKNWEEYQDREGQSIFDGFLELLRNKGVRVSMPEWLQFLQVIGKKTKANELKELVGTNELLNKVRLFAQMTLVKDKADEASFHEAFDEYFELAAKIYNRELQQKEDENKVEEKESRDSDVEPELKDQLGIKEVKENLSEDEEHKDNEEVHGGEKDQHNDILKKEDLSKQGGGDKKEGPSGEGDKGLPSEGKGDKGEAGQGQGDKGKEGQGKGDKGEAGAGKGDKGEAGAGKGDKGQPSGMGKGSSGLKTENQTGDSSEIPESPQNTQQEKTEHGYLVGGGKGKSVFAERVQRDSIHEGEKLDKQAIQEREKRVGKVDRRLRYEERPDKASMREVIRNIRRIILDVSEVKGSNVDLKRTVGNFARRDFRFDYEREREKQPEIVLLIDVGGPVDEWSPLVKEVAEAMAEGLTKLEIYLFHNNLYGYVWKPDPKNLLASSYAKPDSLIDVKKIVKHRKKVIIYGDAEMSYSEFEGDGWPPNGNDERVEKFGMGGEECLNFIKKKADSVVWISPVFQKEWKNRDGSGTIHAVNKVIPMHDLTVGGVEDAIKDLMKK